LEEALNPSALGFGLIILGVFLIFIGLLMMIVLRGGEVEWGGGAIIFIGPFPIAIGGGKLGWFALLIAALLALAMIILLFTTTYWGKPAGKGG